MILLTLLITNILNQHSWCDIDIPSQYNTSNIKHFISIYYFYIDIPYSHYHYQYQIFYQNTISIFKHRAQINTTNN